MIFQTRCLKEDHQLIHFQTWPGFNSFRVSQDIANKMAPVWTEARACSAVNACLVTLCLAANASLAVGMVKRMLILVQWDRSFSPLELSLGFYCGLSCVVELLYHKCRWPLCLQLVFAGQNSQASSAGARLLMKEWACMRQSRSFSPWWRKILNFVCLQNLETVQWLYRCLRSSLASIKL